MRDHTHRACPLRARFHACAAAEARGMDATPRPHDPRRGTTPSPAVEATPCARCATSRTAAAAPPGPAPLRTGAQQPLSPGPATSRQRAAPLGRSPGSPSGPTTSLPPVGAPHRRPGTRPGLRSTPLRTMGAATPRSACPPPPLSRRARLACLLPSPRHARCSPSSCCVTLPPTPLPVRAPHPPASRVPRISCATPASRDRLTAASLGTAPRAVSPRPGPARTSLPSTAAHPRSFQRDLPPSPSDPADVVARRLGLPAFPSQEFFTR